MIESGHSPAPDVDDPRLPPVRVTLDGPTAAAVGRALFWMIEDDAAEVHLEVTPYAVEIVVGRTTTTVDRRGPSG